VTISDIFGAIENSLCAIHRTAANTARMQRCFSNRKHNDKTSLLVEPNIDQHRYESQKGRAKCPSPGTYAFFLSMRGFFSVGNLSYFLSLSPFILPKWKDKPNIHSGNNNLLRGART
jgi:hypothetical protein